MISSDLPAMRSPEEAYNCPLTLHNRQLSSCMLSAVMMFHPFFNVVKLSKNKCSLCNENYVQRWKPALRKLH